MFDAFPSSRRLPTTFRVADIVVVAISATVLAVWAALAAGVVSLGAWLACQAAFFAFYLTGSLLAGWRSLAAGIRFDLPLRLLVGYCAVNTALFVLAWVSPLGILGNFGMVSGLVAAAFVATRPTRLRGGLASTGPWAVLLALVAAALWCQDSILPFQTHAGFTTVKPWSDGFFHASHIRMFSVAHGAASIQDYRLAGVPVRLYHYAAYLTPALLKYASGLPSYAIFGGVLVPMGVFFTGLGAYVLVASFWGAWPGLGACAALLLLPDGAQQGMRNTFLSYHWLAQISPGGTYGLSVVALAWLFVLRGSTRGSLFQIGVGWSFGVVLAFYKAHFFVASALLLITLPPFVFRGRLRRSYRAVWLTVAVAAFVSAVVVTQELPGFPLIRLDGSATGRLFDLVLSFASPTAIGAFVSDHTGTSKAWIPNVVLGGIYLLLGILGVVAPVLVALMLHLRRRVAPLLVAFPLIIACNFLVMALGMAMDNTHVGVPEELQHRPLLLMYFVLLAWTGAAGTFVLLRSRWSTRLARPVVVGLVLLLLVVPARNGVNLQSIPTMAGEYRLRFPTSLMHVMEFMRDHGRPTDVFQASTCDPGHAVAALSDRQPYVGVQRFWPRESERALFHARTSQVVQLMQLDEAGMVIMTASRMGLRWFLLFPEHGVAWPPAITNQPAFADGGYKLYRFY
jgi:hypothetical protein